MLPADNLDVLPGRFGVLVSRGFPDTPDVQAVVLTYHMGDVRVPSSMVLTSPVGDVCVPCLRLFRPLEHREERCPLPATLSLCLWHGFSPIVHEVRPDDGVRSSRFHLRALGWPAIQRLLHQPGQVAEGYALVLALLAESVTCGSNVLVIQIQGT